MTDYLGLTMTEREIGAVSSLGLAHLGDCVYELMVRSLLLAEGKLTNRGIHAATMEYVTAKAQAAAIEALLPRLTDEELSVYRRGRNTRVNSVPKNADMGEYHAATGLECLFGWLYLMGRRDRLNELFGEIIALRH